MNSPVIDWTTTEMDAALKNPPAQPRKAHWPLAMLLALVLVAAVVDYLAAWPPTRSSVRRRCALSNGG